MTIPSVQKPPKHDYIDNHQLNKVKKKVEIETRISISIEIVSYFVIKIDIISSIQKYCLPGHEMDGRALHFFTKKNPFS